MPWISNLLLPIQKALQALSYLLLSLGSFSHRYLPPHLQIHHSTLSGWGIFHEAHTLFPAFRCSLPNLSPWVLCNFFTSTAQEPQLITRQRHLLTFSCFLCLEWGSWWCRRWCGAHTPLYIQEISISRCAALTFCYWGTENWFSLFVAADVTGSVPMHMTYVFQLSAGHRIMHLWFCSDLEIIPFLSTGFFPIWNNIFLGQNGKTTRPNFFHSLGNLMPFSH